MKREYNLSMLGNLINRLYVEGAGLFLINNTDLTTQEQNALNDSKILNNKAREICQKLKFSFTEIYWNEINTTVENSNWSKENLHVTNKIYKQIDFAITDYLSNDDLLFYNLGSFIGNNKIIMFATTQIPDAIEMLKDTKVPIGISKFPKIYNISNELLEVMQNLDFKKTNELISKLFDIIEKYSPEKSEGTLKIFLASSSELNEDRKEFEIFISRKNKEFIKKGIFLELVLWEDFIDAMSDTTSQDEYNKAIQECDIFVSLFHTKVGKYTNNEFETAYDAFKQNGKPLIYTYFKDTAVNLSEISREINSLFDFKIKLDDLGHFYTYYTNIHELNFKFDSQLDKLLPKLTGKKTQ